MSHMAGKPYSFLPRCKSFSFVHPCSLASKALGKRFSCISQARRHRVGCVVRCSTVVAAGAADSGPAAESKGKTKSSKPSEPSPSQESAASSGQIQGLKFFHLAAFVIILGAGLVFLAVLLYFTADIQFQRACLKVVRRLFKTVAARQVLGILAAMAFVRFGLEPLVKGLRHLFTSQGPPWEKSSEYYILREVL